MFFFISPAPEWGGWVGGWRKYKANSHFFLDFPCLVPQDLPCGGGRFPPDPVSQKASPFEKNFKLFGKCLYPIGMLHLPSVKSRETHYIQTIQIGFSWVPPRCHAPRLLLFCWIAWIRTTVCCKFCARFGCSSIHRNNSYFAGQKLEKSPGKRPLYFFYCQIWIAFDIYPPKKHADMFSFWSFSQSFPLKRVKKEWAFLRKLFCRTSEFFFRTHSPVHISI